MSPSWNSQRHNSYRFDLFSSLRNLQVLLIISLFLTNYIARNELSASHAAQGSLNSSIETMCRWQMITGLYSADSLMALRLAF